MKPKKTGQNYQKSCDFGTLELSLRHTTRLEPLGPRLGGVRIRVLNGNELDRLFHAGNIDNNQHNAGLKLGGDVSRASGSSGWLASLTGATQKGGMSGGRFLFAVHRISKAMRHVQKEKGREIARILMRVVADQMVIENKTQLSALEGGLDALSFFYSQSAPSSLR